MGDFEKDTALNGGNGSYKTTLSRDWDIWGPNGGYLAAIALRAAGREAKIPKPVAFAAHYLRVAKFEPVDVQVTSLHGGRRSESLRVSMLQDGRPILEALVRTAADGEGLQHDTTAAPDVPNPDALPPSHGESKYKFWDHFDGRPTAGEAWGEDRSSEDPVYREWLRFQPRANYDDPFLDAARGLVFIDTMLWPATCRHHVQPAYLAPNLDVVAWFHRPFVGEEWMLIDAEAPLGQSGLVGGSVKIWSADRRLLASGGAQLLCVPAPAQ